MKPPDVSERGFLALVVGAAAVYLVHGLWPDLVPNQVRVMATYGSIVKMAFQLLAALWAWANAASFPAGSSSRRAWRGLGLGMALVFLGQAWLSQYQLPGQTAPFPTWADVAFVAAYLPLIGGLVSFLAAYKKAGFPVAARGRDVVVTTFILAVGVTSAWPVLRAAVLAPGGGLGHGLGIAYPALDLLLLAPALLVLLAVLPFRQGAVGRIWLAIIAGFAAWVAADLLFAWPSTAAWIGPVSNAFYLLAYGFLALGARYQRRLLE